jgi:hypothetical protein
MKLRAMRNLVNNKGISKLMSEVDNAIDNAGG